jgi:hypothetical protein
MSLHDSRLQCGIPLACPAYSVFGVNDVFVTNSKIELKNERGVQELLCLPMF